MWFYFIFFWAGDITEELVDSFFEAEVEMERKICRDVVCNSRKDEEGKRTSASCALHTVMETLRRKRVALWW